MERITDITIDQSPSGGYVAIKQGGDMVMVAPCLAQEVADAIRTISKDMQPAEEVEDDPTARAMNEFFDCYFKFTAVARGRGVHDEDMRLKLFEIYERRE